MSRATASKSSTGRKPLSDLTNFQSKKTAPEHGDETDEESSGDEEEEDFDVTSIKKKREITGKKIPDFNEFRAKPKPTIGRKRKFDQSVRSFDHHSPPPASTFHKNPYPDIFTPEPYTISRQKTPSFKYSKPDIETQINEWHVKDVKFVINSVKLDKRDDKYPGALIYKRTGNTAGQVISWSVSEIELIVKLFANQIFPDIFEFGLKANKIPECDFVQESVTFQYTPFDFKEA
jgi:hypothetical protein